MTKRYTSAIKFFNFCRENKLAPISVKIKILKSCVMSSLLYNCETFGNKIPKNLESLYGKLIRCVLQVRANTPLYLLYVESGLLPIQALVEARQYKFYNRFLTTLQEEGDRKYVIDQLARNPSKYLKHYLELSRKYNDQHDIYHYHFENIKSKIRDYATNNRYKFDIYLKMNPTLEKSPFLDCFHPNAADITRFRLGSHNLPIEKGRWSRINRENRICTTCNTLGDEKHVIHDCNLIFREDLNLINDDLCSIWTQHFLFI